MSSASRLSWFLRRPTAFRAGASPPKAERRGRHRIVPILQGLENRVVPSTLAFQASPTGPVNLLLIDSGGSFVVENAASGKVLASNPVADTDAIQITGAAGVATALNIRLDLSSVTAPISFTGQSGADSLTVLDQLFLDESYELTNSELLTADYDEYPGTDFTGSISYSNVASLQVTSTGLSARYSILSTAAGTTTTVSSTQGPETVNIGDFNMDAIQGALNILGDASYQNTVALDDEAEAQHTYTLSTSGNVSTYTRDGLPPITYKNMQNVFVGMADDSTILIPSTAAGTVTTIDAESGQGPTTAIIGNTANTLNNLQGAVSMIGNFGYNPINVTVNDQGSTTAHTYTLNSLGLTRSGAAPITFVGFYTMQLNGGSGSEVYDVDGLSPDDGPTTIQCGSGKNMVNISPTDHDLDDFPPPYLGTQLTVEGVAGATGSVAVNVDDQSHFGARTWTLTNGLLALANSNNGPGFQLAFANLGSLTVNGGNYGNVFDVQGTPAGTAVTLNTGDGINAVNVGDQTQTLDEMLGTLTVNGQSGTNTLTINYQGEPLARSIGDTWYSDHAQFRVTPDPSVVQTIYFHNVQQTIVNDQANIEADNVHVIEPNSPATHLTINGNAANDIIEADVNSGQTQTVQVNGRFAGTINNKITYDGTISAILGIGAGTTDFKFLPGGFEDEVSVLGPSGGSGGSGVLDFSAYSPAITVDLPQTTVQEGAVGSVPGVVPVFQNITKVIGTSGTDTLVGADTANTWSITGRNSGKADGVSFSSFENLTGGGVSDDFQFASGGLITGTLSGGGGMSTLDYSGYTGNVTVDLPLGTASLVGGAVQDIQDVVGSIGNDILVGNGTGNTLTGGTGRNLLIAGDGPGTLKGGGNDDILIGGTTAYDSNLKALAAIMAEWVRTDLSYAARVDHLLNGGGKNGADVLNTTTFTANAGGNILTGAGGLNLYFGSVTLDTNDWNPNIGEVFVEKS